MTKIDTKPQRTKLTLKPGKGNKTAGRKWSHQDYLQSLVGKEVVLGMNGAQPVSGMLISADAYALLIERSGLKPSLFFKSAVGQVKEAEDQR